MNENDRQLVEQFRLLNIAMEAAADGIFITDAGGRIEWCNPAFLEMTGLEAGEVVNHTPRILKAGAQDKVFYKEMWDTVLSGKTWRGELTDRRKNGQVFIARLTSTPVLDAMGSILHFVVIIQDITEQKNAELALRRREASLNLMLETLPVGVWILDKTGKILRGNRASQEIWAGARYVGIDNYSEYKGWWVHNGKLIQPQEWAATRAITRGEISIEEEIEIECFDGAHKFILNSALPLLDENGEIEGVIVINQDVTARLLAERALVHANELLERLFSAVDILIAYMDQEFNYIRVNRAYAEFAGHDPDYFIAKNHFDLFPGRDNELIFHRVIETGEPYLVYEKAFPFKAHSERSISVWDWSLQPVKDGRGAVQGAVLTLMDMTGRVQAERALQESEARYRTLVENSPNGILVLDYQHTIQYANQCLVEMYGTFDNQDLAGRSLVTLFSPQECDLVEKIIGEVAAKGPVINVELSFLRFDRTSLPVEFSLSAMKNLDDQMVVFIGELRDIASRKQADEIIRQNANRAMVLSEVSTTLAEASLNEQAIFAAVARAVAVHIGDSATIRIASDDRQWLDVVAFYHVNPRANELMKIALDSYRQPATDTVQGQVFQSGQLLFIPQVNVKAIRDQAPEIYHGYIDEIGISSMMILPLRVQNDIIGTIAMYRDAGGAPYTEDDLTLVQNLADRVALALANARLYRELENALRNEQAVREQLVRSERFAVAGRMLASITHEINNPIQTIKNCLYLSEQDLPPDSSVHSFLSIAASETERIANLVAQLREIYRPVGKGQEILINLHSLLLEIESLLAPYLASAHVNWQLEETASPDRFIVRGVIDQLKQVFLNLSLNAIEAMQPVGGHLSVGIYLKGDAQKVNVIFKDTGLGIQPRDLPNIFEPFFTTKSAGLGLGLPICFDIIKNHNGQITVHSAPGEGATFSVLLPLATAQEPACSITGG